MALILEINNNKNNREACYKSVGQTKITNTMYTVRRNRYAIGYKISLLLLSDVKSIPGDCHMSLTKVCYLCRLYWCAM